MCSGEHNEQATFEVASFFTLRLRIAQGKMHTGSRAVLSVHDLSPTSLYKNKEGVNLQPGGKAPPVVWSAVQTRGAGSHRSSAVNMGPSLALRYLKRMCALPFLLQVSSCGAESQRKQFAETRTPTFSHFVLARMRAGTRG
jgi:hypothetical protein